MPDRSPAPHECANCGADIPPGAKACPECGADERTGWRETSVYDGLDLPDDESEPRRAHGRTSRDVNGLRWYWWCAGVAILLFFALAVLALV